MKRTAEVHRDAKIGEAEATKDSGIKVTFNHMFIAPVYHTWTANGIGAVL